MKMSFAAVKSPISMSVVRDFGPAAGFGIDVVRPAEFIALTADK